MDSLSPLQCCETLTSDHHIYLSLAKRSFLSGLILTLSETVSCSHVFSVALFIQILVWALICLSDGSCEVTFHFSLLSTK